MSIKVVEVGDRQYSFLQPQTYRVSNKISSDRGDTRPTKAVLNLFKRFTIIKYHTQPKLLGLAQLRQERNEERHESHENEKDFEVQHFIAFRVFPSLFQRPNGALAVSE